MRGWIALGLSVICGAAWAEGPSFDCAKAEHDAETAVCARPELAELDREVARLYHLALNGAHMTPDRASTLRAMQRGWIKGRNDCWKSSRGLETCVAAEYGFRIDDLRREYADARAEEGSSNGPFAFVCDGFAPVVSATFVNTSAAMVVLRWLDNAIVLPSVRSGSGAKYAADDWVGPEGDPGPSVFWTKGDTAQFQVAGGPTWSCQQDETG